MNAPTAVWLLFLIKFIFAVDAFADKDLWIVFKEDHGKTYKSLLEEKIRFNNFQENLIKIKNHNERYEKGEESYFLKVTPNADLTEEEFRRKLILGARNMPTSEGLLRGELETHGNLSSVPDSLDWRKMGAVLGVKNQGRCGSCWAFSATGALEGQNAIRNKKLIALSEQQLLDCSTSYGNGDCLRGGLMNFAFEYVKDHGIESEREYPYEGMKGRCRADSAKKLIKVEGYKRVPKHEKYLKIAIATIGPISVSLDATFFHLYGGGIFDHKFCSSTIPNHGVLLVGYGRQDGKDYWLIKNSWGTSWGEKGYIRMVRNARNQCGIANGAVYPVIG